jgi:hypothetical protein
MQLTANQIKLIAKFCADKKHHMKSLQAVKFDFENQTFTASNGHVLIHGSWQGEKTEFHDGEDNWVLIPSSTLSAVAKERRGHETVEITMNEIDGLGFKPLLETFPDVNRVLASGRNNKKVQNGQYGFYQSGYIKLIEETKKIAPMTVYKPENPVSALYFDGEWRENFKVEVLLMPCRI